MRSRSRKSRVAFFRYAAHFCGVWDIVRTRRRFVSPNMRGHLGALHLHGSLQPEIRFHGQA